jgi:hypothetical protein
VDVESGGVAGFSASAQGEQGCALLLVCVDAVASVGGGVLAFGRVGRHGGAKGVDQRLLEKDLHGVAAAAVGFVIGGAEAQMNVRGASLIPAGNDGGELHFAGGVGDLVSAQPGICCSGLAAFCGIDALRVAVPDINLNALHGHATVLTVENIEVESEGDALLRAGAVEVGKDVAAQIAAGAVVDEVGPSSPSNVSAQEEAAPTVSVTAEEVLAA